MVVTLLPILTVSKLVQEENALSPMLVTVSPIVTFSILLLEAGKYVGTNPLAVEPTSGVLITSLVIAEHPVNTLSPMLVTLLPILTVSKLVQDRNAPPPMFVTLSGILTVSKLEHR